MKHAKHFNPRFLYQRAKELRFAASSIEQRVWFKLREQQKTHNLKFRCQHPVAGYVVDFACLSAKIIIEIDGDSHIGTEAYDKKREQELRQEGYDIIRFSNQDVHQNIEMVIDTILHACLTAQRATA